MTARPWRGREGRKKKREKRRKKKKIKYPNETIFDHGKNNGM